MAAVTTPNDEAVLFAAEEQAQRDTDALVKALEEANCRCDKVAVEELTGKEAMLEV